MRYRIEGRYQDSRWESLGGEGAETFGAAVGRACDLARQDGSCMVRVVDSCTAEVIGVDPEGGWRREPVYLDGEAARLLGLAGGDPGRAWW